MGTFCHVLFRHYGAMQRLADGTWAAIQTEANGTQFVLDDGFKTERDAQNFALMIHSHDLDQEFGVAA